MGTVHVVGLPTGGLIHSSLHCESTGSWSYYRTQSTVTPWQFLTSSGSYLAALAFPCFLGLFCACVTRAVPLLSIVLVSLDFLLQQGGG